MTKTKEVFLNEVLVGKLFQVSGHTQFVYDKNYLSAKKHPLSVSLPLREESFKKKECEPFFSGLLPEEEHRKIIASKFDIYSKNFFELLAQIGGECAGAVSVLPEGKEPAFSKEYKLLNDEELLENIKLLPANPLLIGIEEGIRLSMAGVQRKMLVHVDSENGSISLPLDGSPSTHILKPDIDKKFPNIVYNEAFCLELANLIGIPTAKFSVGIVGDIEYLLVERYDRMIGDDGDVKRVHQEDFCQAMGILPEDKYQSEGGPGLRKCFELLNRVSALPAVDINNLLKAVIFNVIVGNCDAHGKNFSLIYSGDKNIVPRFAPLYDLVSTAYYPHHSTSMAMKIGGERDFKKFSKRNFEKFVKETDLSFAMFRDSVLELSSKVKSSTRSLRSKYEKVSDLVDLIGKRVEEIERVVKS